MSFVVDTNLVFEQSLISTEENAVVVGNVTPSEGELIHVDGTSTANRTFAYDIATEADSTVWIITTPTSCEYLSVSVNGQIVNQRRYSTTTATSISTSTNYYINTSATTSTWSSSTNGFWTPISGINNLNVDWSDVRKKVRGPLIKKSTRNSIKRALKLMCGMGFEEDVRVFLNGDTVEVSHPNSLFKFVIQKYERSLIHRTEYPGVSTPYRLQLYTKSDIHIANLCVYMKDTPVLDQVLGLAMFIKSGSEEMILKKANWSCLHDDMETREILALEYPYLRDKLRLNQRRVEEFSYIDAEYINEATINGTLTVNAA